MIQLGLLFVQYILSLATTGNIIFAGTDNYSAGSSGVYLSTNNGASWLNKNQGFNVIPTVSTLLISNNYIFAGTYSYSLWRRSLSDIIGLKQISEIVPAVYSLHQNYPNPFNPSTKIRYKIKDSRFVTLKVYDILGKEIVTLVNEKQSPGEYEVPFSINQFSGYQLPSGVYFYQLRAGDLVETKKMILLK